MISDALDSRRWATTHLAVSSSDEVAARAGIEPRQEGGLQEREKG